MYTHTEAWSQEPPQKGTWKDCKSQRSAKGKTIFGVTALMSTQQMWVSAPEQARQHFSMERGRLHEHTHLAGELLTAHGFWGEGRSGFCFLFKDVGPTILTMHQCHTICARQHNLDSRGYIGEEEREEGREEGRGRTARRIREEKRKRGRRKVEERRDVEEKEEEDHQKSWKGVEDTEMKLPVRVSKDS